LPLDINITPSNLQESGKNCLHIFLINNPVTLIISKMIADELEIPEENIKIISLRSTNTSLFHMPSIEPIISWKEKYFVKFFRHSLSMAKVLKDINPTNKSFFLYSSWTYLQAEQLMNSKMCKAHIYIEEGQASYRNCLPYQYIKTNLYQRFQRDRIRNAENNTQLYRDDAAAFIGLSRDVFPSVTSSKRIVLDNLNALKAFYKPSLLGISHIGLTCAARRVPPSMWRAMFLKIIDSLPSVGGAIKLHPSFIYDPKAIELFEEILDEVNHKDIVLCRYNVLLELEMLFEPKYLIGPLTSLSRYAKFLGSEFEHIKLY
jgi:hypothetical protein